MALHVAAVVLPLIYVAALASGARAAACAEGCAEKFKQCGGTKSTPEVQKCCDDDFQCVRFSKWYSQCRPKKWELVKTKDAAVLDCDSESNGGSGSGNGGNNGGEENCPDIQMIWRGVGAVGFSPDAALQECVAESDYDLANPDNPCFDPNYAGSDGRLDLCANACNQNPDCFVWNVVDFLGCSLYGKDAVDDNLFTDYGSDLGFVKCFQPEPACPPETLREVDPATENYVQADPDFDWAVGDALQVYQFSVDVRPESGATVVGTCASVCVNLIISETCVAVAVQDPLETRGEFETASCILLFKGVQGLPFPDPSDSSDYDFKVYNIEDCLA